MTARELVQYSLRYAMTYVGILALLFAGVSILASFVEFRPEELSIGALIGAALFTYNRFLRDKMRLPNRGEYWSLVLSSTIIVVVVEFIVGALAIHFTRDYGLDPFIVLILIGVPFLKGLFGSMIFYSRFLGERSLKQLRRKSERAPDPVRRTSLSDCRRHVGGAPDSTTSQNITG